MGTTIAATCGFCVVSVENNVVECLVPFSLFVDLIVELFNSKVNLFLSPFYKHKWVMIIGKKVEYCRLSYFIREKRIIKIEVIEQLFKQ